MRNTRSGRRAAVGVVVALCLLGVGAPAAAQSSRLDHTRITLRGSELPLGSVLNQIARAAGLALVADKDVRLDRMVPSPNLDDVAISTALSVVLTPLGYSFALEEKDRQLQVFVYETRTFRVAMPVVAQDWAAGIANSGPAEVSSGAGGALGARVALSVRSDTKGLWEEIDNAMASLLGEERRGGDKEKDRGPSLGTYSVNRVAGFVTVRGLPSVMPAIKSYFDALNDEMGRSIAVETRVYQVEISDTRAASIDWSLLAARLGDVAFIGGQAIRSALVGDSSPFLRLSGRAGDAFIRALEEQGEVKILAQPTLTLGNNLPAIIELAQVQAYVSQQTTTVIQGGMQTTVQTSALSDGLIISMLPRLLEGGEVSLALATIMQDVLEVRREDFGNGFVELPKTSRRSYSGVVRALPNETLVIGGLITTRQEKVDSGVPFLSRIPIVGWLFGATRHVDKKSELIITVTPRDVHKVAAKPSTLRIEPGVE